jgi:hypothetical protein
MAADSESPKSKNLLEAFETERSGNRFRGRRNARGPVTSEHGDCQEETGDTFYIRG